MIIIIIIIINEKFETGVESLKRVPLGKKNYIKDISSKV